MTKRKILKEFLLNFENKVDHIVIFIKTYEREIKEEIAENLCFDLIFFLDSILKIISINTIKLDGKIAVNKKYLEDLRQHFYFYLFKILSEIDIFKSSHLNNIVFKKLLNKVYELEAELEKTFSKLSPSANSVNSFKNNKFFSYIDTNLEVERDLFNSHSYIKSLLPQNLSDNNLSTKSIFIPYNMVGGDFFNYYYINSQKLVIYLIDIGGHSLTSSLVSISVSTIINTIVSQNIIEPVDVFSHLNKYFFNLGGDVFITLWYGIYDVLKRELTFASTGTPPAFLIKEKGRIFKLKKDNLIIGLQDNYKHKQAKVSMSKNSHLILFSDGVIEILKNNRIMTLRELHKTIKLFKNESHSFYINKIYNHLFSDSSEYQLRDDFSIIEFIFK